MESSKLKITKYGETRKLSLEKDISKPRSPSLTMESIKKTKTAVPKHKSNSVEKFSLENTLLEHDPLQTSKIEEIVEINCGGTLFTTFKSTLLSKPSMLASMFSGRFPLVKDSQGRYFIDRNPKTFEMILDYLRTNETLCFRGFKNQDFLRRELEYFGLYTPSLYNDLLSNPSSFSITWDSDSKSEDISVDLHSIICQSNIGWKSIFSNESFCKRGTMSFRFRIDNNPGGLLIGIATENFDIHDRNAYCGSDQFSWSIQSDCGFIFHRTVYKGFYGKPLKAGDVVDMRLDLDHRVLSFSINDEDYGVAYNRLPKKATFYVCVSLSGENTTLSVLPGL